MRQRLAFFLALAMTAFVVALALTFAVLLNPQPGQAAAAWPAGILEPEEKERP